MEEYFNPYLKVIKTCDSVASCWHGGKTPKAIDGTTDIYVKYGVILPDGGILAVYKTRGGILFFYDVDGIKGQNRSGRDIFNYYLVNVNTLVEPEGCHTTFINLKSGLYPGGYTNCYAPFTQERSELLGTNIDRGCNKNAKNVSIGGDACAAVIMRDGWKISDDYPW